MTNIRQLLNNRAQVYKTDMERDILFQIITNMRNLQLEYSRAKGLSEEFLKSTITDDLDEVFRSLKIMSSNYPEAREVYIKYIEKYLGEKTDHAINKIHSHMQKGEIDKALKTAKGGTA